MTGLKALQQLEDIHTEMLLALKIVAAMREHSKDGFIILMESGDVMNAVTAAIKAAEEVI